MLIYLVLCTYSKPYYCGCTSSNRPPSSNCHFKKQNISSSFPLFLCTLLKCLDNESVVRFSQISQSKLQEAKVLITGPGYMPVHTPIGLWKDHLFVLIQKTQASLSPWHGAFIQHFGIHRLREVVDLAISWFEETVPTCQVRCLKRG